MANSELKLKFLKAGWYQLIFFNHYKRSILLEILTEPFKQTNNRSVMYKVINSSRNGVFQHEPSFEHKRYTSFLHL